MSVSRFDFDTVINRNNTHCEKWDDMQAYFGVSPADGGIPLWVADMEFLPPPAVKEALASMLEGVLGYTGDYREYHAAIAGWMQGRHGWTIKPEWIFATHGIVMAVNTIVQAFCRPGDNVILQTPVYYPFFGAVRNNGCRVTANRLVRNGQGKYEMDFDALEAQMDGRTRMIVLCSPHNPGGRVWTRQELERLAEMCCRHDVLIVSDEIHHDLVYGDAGHPHTVMASLSPEVAARTITCTSATKTFNLAGTLTGNVIISDPALHRQFERQMHRAGMFLPNAFGMAAATAAYTQGDDWLDTLLPYLAANRDAVAQAVAGLSSVSTMPLEGTYLAWLDFSGYCAETGRDMQEVVRRIQQEARLALNHGHTFGPGGESCMRLNFACAKSQLSEALQRFVQVLV
ncbi:pyridoxal phosphate-dependent aminotransferase [Desulfovibrio mangrovi]|uniref:MalY/PatB family protein n=1 Tax=Desulfovibrio mangrovi TaxID=2976983 RepID=UPI002248235F|nr:MalY/PatB family protein [Desulfovibrio mangrovi]UZP66529.1 pyridoxal phosphate-dependent aminotransferase [Desulfovibrio mangrovi]